MTITSRKRRELGKQVVSILDYLKETGLPCNVTLYYLDEELERTRERGVHINIDKIPMDIIKGQRNYSIKLSVKKLPGIPSIKDYDPNKMKFSSIQDCCNYIYGDYITNHKRKTRLDDILNDPNPPTQVPV